MIHWETPSRSVACTGCQSTDTQVWFEFLTFTRHVCRACRTTFVAAAERPADMGPLSLTFAETQTGIDMIQAERAIARTA